MDDMKGASFAVIWIQIMIKVTIDILEMSCDTLELALIASHLLERELLRREE